MVIFATKWDFERGLLNWPILLRRLNTNFDSFTRASLSAKGCLAPGNKICAPSGPANLKLNDYTT